MFAKRLTVGLIALFGTCVVVACGSSSPTSDQSGGRTTPTVTVTTPVTVTAPASTTTTGARTTTTGTSTTGTSTTSTGSQTAACVAADLTPSFLGTNGAAGTIAVGFALENTSGAPCHTYGWPGVLFLSSSGAGLTTNATRTTSDMLGSTPAAEITLKPGQEASFRIIASDFSESSDTNCPNATGLQIIAPDDTATMKVAISGGVPACGKATVSPLMAGTGAWNVQ